MNVLAKKLSIIEWLLKLQDENILEKIGSLVESNIDKWDQLTEEQKAELNEAIAEINSGKGIPHENVMSKLRNR